MKTNLMRANEELFRRKPDEHFASFNDLWQHCYSQREKSEDNWNSPSELIIQPTTNSLELVVDDTPQQLNDWSFGQICSLSRVSKETVNRLTPDTASRVFQETFPRGSKPMQTLTQGGRLRSIHGASYTRLYNVELLSLVREFATDFQPPQRAGSIEDMDSGSPSACGLYCGEQDMFTFLIDPTGWIEIEGEAFAPGFFLWNSEVGKRTVGVQTFWFQAVCQNHIVWDAVEVMEFSRKHTANVHDALRHIQRLIAQLVARRDDRRDSFAKVIKNAMQTKLGDTNDDVLEILGKKGISKTLANEALKIAEKQGRFTIFALVDALTRLAQNCQNAGDRSAVDVKSASLLAMAV